MPVVNYVWDVVSDNVLMETDDEGGTIARYVQEPGLYGQAISQERDGQVRYYNYDGLGDTSELTDENQDVTDTYEYTAFGEEVDHTGTTENPFRYKGSLGYYTDSETDDVYVRARTYQPTIARWLSTDPVGFIDGCNRFAFLRNNPLGRMDPSGLKCVEVCSNYHLFRGGPLSAYDENYVGTPYQDLAAVMRRVANAEDGGRGRGLVWPQLTEAGVHHTYNTSRVFESLRWLFFRNYSICETSHCDCRIFLDETGTTITTISRSGQRQVEHGINHGDITDAVDTVKADASPTNLSRGPCKRSIIYADFPGGHIARGVWGWEIRLKQTITIKDRETGDVLHKWTDSISISFDMNGNANPIPDVVHRPTGEGTNNSSGVRRDSGQFTGLADLNQEVILPASHQCCSSRSHSPHETHAE